MCQLSASAGPAEALLPAFGAVHDSAKSAAVSPAVEVSAAGEGVHETAAATSGSGGHAGVDPAKEEKHSDLAAKTPSVVSMPEFSFALSANADRVRELKCSRHIQGASCWGAPLIPSSAPTCVAPMLFAEPYLYPEAWSNLLGQALWPDGRPACRFAPALTDISRRLLLLPSPGACINGSLLGFVCRGLRRRLGTHAATQRYRFRPCCRLHLSQLRNGFPVATARELWQNDIVDVIINLSMASMASSTSAPSRKAFVVPATSTSRASAVARRLTFDGCRFWACRRASSSLFST